MKHNAYESYNFSFTCFLKLKWEYKYAFYYITLIHSDFAFAAWKLFTKNGHTITFTNCYLSFFVWTMIWRSMILLVLPKQCHRKETVSCKSSIMRSCLWQFSVLLLGVDSFYWYCLHALVIVCARACCSLHLDWVIYCKFIQVVPGSQPTLSSKNNEWWLSFMYSENTQREMALDKH